MRITFDRAKRLMEPLAARKGAPRAYRVKLQRLRQLAALARVGEALAKMVLDQGRLDLSALRNWRAGSGESD